MKHHEYRQAREQTSASALISAGFCEQEFGYRYAYADRIVLPEPIALTYGTVIHKAAERIWKGEFEKEKDAVNKTYGYLTRVLDGVHGPVREGSPVVSISWVSSEEAQRLSETELKERIAELREKHFRRMYLTVRALYRQYVTLRERVDEVHTELDIAPHHAAIRSANGRLYALSGKLDLVVFLKDGSYAVIDFKTGWTILNADRPKIIRDIQMTLYAYAATTIFKRPPTYLILQPVDLPKGALHTPGAVEALRRQRIVVPPRTQAHYEELGNLIEDIRRMRELIAAHDGPAREARDAWEPVSAWGKQAGLKQNAVEGRYIPRIGRWCARCQFREVCREENAIDWAAYQKDALEARAPATQPAETPLVRSKQHLLHRPAWTSALPGHLTK
jgi:hypothetical protein